MNKKTTLPIIGFVILCLVVGALSGISTAASIESWYQYLEKPSFNPPNWIFGPVWTTLYILMGISAGKIWSLGISRTEVKQAMIYFGVHLLLNAMWSVLFFGLQNPELAFAEIIILLISILIFVRKFYHLEAWTAWLQLPYILWVSFATVLNGAIMVLN